MHVALDARGERGWDQKNPQFAEERIVIRLIVFWATNSQVKNILRPPLRPVAAMLQVAIAKVFFWSTVAIQSKQTSELKRKSPASLSKEPE